MSTSTFQGLPNERSSTRLHAPPGGKTSISLFGGYEGEDQPQRHTGRRMQQNIVQNSIEQAPVQQKVAQSPVPAPAPVTHSSPLHESNTQSQNATTENSIGDRASTRVKQPPGGRSTFSFY
eukprot:TRINITY_DN8804_c0_g1_i1.p2 TRINITY_DN8804_c0_g1~~TRINITY_DN8804_c0_g1_i1.p2  ORF type:complete len:121 (+),score=31.90 TRINITY_DN8804_c0_g1_i1:60-422(+)